MKENQRIKDKINSLNAEIKQLEGQLIYNEKVAVDNIRYKKEMEDRWKE